VFNAIEKWSSVYWIQAKWSTDLNNLTWKPTDLAFADYGLLTYLWSWALLEKLPIVQLLKNFPSFYGTLRLTNSLIH
jgi:hypothetical protein